MSTYMTKFKYREYLLHPSWKKCRLQILERDGYKCTQCGSTTNLQVHHKYYIAGSKPWEVPQKCLTTLCDICHKGVHDTTKIKVIEKKIAAKKKKAAKKRLNKSLT